MIKVEIINARETSRFKNIRLDSLKESPNAFGTTYEKALTWDKKNWEAQVTNMNTFIASIDGEDVGVVRTVLDKDDRKVAWIISMWTLPSARGKSVGSKLLESVIDWANSSNIKSIKLDVVDSNDSAVRLYQRELTLY
jgi:GNAT superfamily N-acetyltransferase